MVNIVKMFQEKFGIKIEWNFFAEQHGKGVVDGVGAQIKQKVHSKIRNRQVRVTCAADFVGACTNSDVDVMFMSNEEVQRRQVALDVKTLNQKAKTVKNISTAHHIKFVEDVTVINVLTEP
jgi:hypothetical protein